jgi:acetolactate synthase-1/2/3 large subunit
MLDSSIFNYKRVLFSGGMGALPSACMGSNKRTGDGGIQMNIQELEVIKRRQLPIKIFVLNNRNYTLIRNI